MPAFLLVLPFSAAATSHAFFFLGGHRSTTHSDTATTETAKEDESRNKRYGGGGGGEVHERTRGSSPVLFSIRRRTHQRAEETGSARPHTCGCCWKKPSRTPKLPGQSGVSSRATGAGRVHREPLGVEGTYMPQKHIPLSPPPPRAPFAGTKRWKCNHRDYNGGVYHTGVAGDKAVCGTVRCAGWAVVFPTPEGQQGRAVTCRMRRARLCASPTCSWREKKFGSSQGRKLTKGCLTHRARRERGRERMKAWRLRCRCFAARGGRKGQFRALRLEEEQQQQQQWSCGPRTRRVALFAHSRTHTNGWMLL